MTSNSIPPNDFRMRRLSLDDNHLLDWTQTLATVSVYLHVPHWVRKHHINVNLRHSSIDLIVVTQDAAPYITLAKQFSLGVDAGSCMWALEEDAQSSTLFLELEKSAPSFWPRLFDDDVPSHYTVIDDSLVGKPLPPAPALEIAHSAEEEESIDQVVNAVVHDMVQSVVGSTAVANGEQKEDEKEEEGSNGECNENIVSNVEEGDENECSDNMPNEGSSVSKRDEITKLKSSSTASTLKSPSVGNTALMFSRTAATRTHSKINPSNPSNNNTTTSPPPSTTATSHSLTSTDNISVSSTPSSRSPSPPARSTEAEETAPTTATANGTEITDEATDEIEKSPATATSTPSSAQPAKEERKFISLEQFLEYEGITIEAEDDAMTTDAKIMNALRLRHREILEKNDRTEIGNLLLQLGSMYHQPSGMQNHLITATLYKKAFMQYGIINNACMFQLGLMYNQGGPSLTKDDKEAVHWWRISAALGNPTAMYNLGVMLINGTGCDMDPVAAFEWFGKAQKIDPSLAPPPMSRDALSRRIAAAQKIKQKNLIPDEVKEQRRQDAIDSIKSIAYNTVVATTVALSIWGYRYWSKNRL